MDRQQGRTVQCGGGAEGQRGMAAKQGGNRECAGGSVSGTPRSPARRGNSPNAAGGGCVYQDDGIYIIRVSPSRYRGRTTRWRVDAYYKGHRASTRACAVFRDQNDADNCAAILWSDYVSGLHAATKVPPATLGALVERFCDRTTGKRGRELSPRTAESYRNHLKGFVTVAGGSCPLSHLSKRHVEAAVSKPPSQKSRATYFRAIRALVRWAVANDWIATDITQGAEVDPGPTEMRPFLQPEKVEAFLAGCAPAHRIRAGLILETGLRAGEAAHLCWSWVQMGVGRPSIRIPGYDPDTSWRSKGRRVRAIPLSLRAQEWLEKAAQRWGREGFVLHGLDHAPLISNWCKDSNEACLKAGITPTVDTHGLRRTAGVLWIAAGLDIYTISRLLGHESVTTTEKAYVGIADSRLAAAFNAVDERRAVVATNVATHAATHRVERPDPDA